MRISHLLLVGCCLVAVIYGAPAPEPKPEPAPEPNPEPAPEPEPNPEPVAEPEPKIEISPDEKNALLKVEKMLKRDRRGVSALSGLLSSGGSSGDRGHTGNEVGGGIDLGGAGHAEAGGQVAGGSDSGSILNLVGPLLGSSSGGGGDDAGSGSGSILGILTPFLGSSSSSSGGSGGDGGGSGLGSILGISKSSKGGHSDGGVVDEHGVIHGGGVISSITGAKLALVSDKIQLLLRLKYGLLTKILNKITSIIAKASIPPEGFELKYPNYYPSKLKVLTGGH